MTVVINDVAPRIHYTATAGQTTFTVPFEFLTNSELKVYVNNVLMTYSTPPANASLYHTTGVGVSGGGTVIFGPPGRAASDKVAIYRDIPVARMEELSPTNAQLEATLDAMTAMIQQNEANIAQRTLHLANSDFMNPLNALPDTETRKNKLLAFDANGQPTVGSQVAGPQGDPGVKGDTGATGAAGAPGAPGAPGVVDYSDPTWTGTSTLYSNDPGTVGPTLKSIHDTPSAFGFTATDNFGSYAGGDQIFRQEFWGKNGAGTDILWGTLRGVLMTVTPGAERMQWFWNTNWKGDISTQHGRVTWDHMHIAVDYYDGGAAAGPHLYLTRNSASAAINDLIGSVRYLGSDLSLDQYEWGTIGMRLLNVTVGQQMAEFLIRGANGAGVLRDLQTMSARDGSILHDIPLTLRSTDAGATAQPILKLFRNSASPAALDALGQILFNGKDAADEITYARIFSAILNPAAGLAEGHLVLEVAKEGGLLAAVTITPLITSIGNRLLLRPSTTAGAGLILPHGVAPTTPANGEMWTETTGLYARINGVTVGPMQGPAGSLASKVSIAGDTMTGKLITKTVSAAGGAGLNLPLGPKPTTPIKGDIFIADEATENSVLTWAGDDGSGGTKYYFAVTTNRDQAIGGQKLFNKKIYAAAANWLFGSQEAAINLMPHDPAPLDTENGDLWAEASGVWSKINGEIARFATTNTHQEINSTKTFTVPPVFPGSNDDLPSFRMVIAGYPLFPEPGWVWMDNGGLYYCVEDGVAIGPLGASPDPTWDSIVGKPSEFPPEDHTHETGEIVGLDAALAAAVEEAPIDGEQYVRKDAGWIVNTGGIPDAPSDGNLYARRNGVWNDLTDNFAEKVDETNGVLLGTPKIGDGTVAAELRFDGGADPTDFASIIAQRAGLNRWGMNFTNLNVESTGNAGSDFSIIRYSDAGTPLALALEINRKTGATKVEGLVITPGTPTTPVNGQMWTDTTGVHARINGSTMQVSPGWRQLTQAAYDAIGTKDPNMLYVVIG